MGRRLKGETYDNEASHNKYSDDNIITKLKTAIFKYILILLNESLVFTKYKFYPLNVKLNTCLKKEFDVKLHRPDFKQMFVQIKGSTDIFINELMPNFYNNFSALLLGFYGGAAANGLYDAGKKLCNIFNTIHGAAISTFFPYFSRKTHRHSQFAKINIVVSVFVSLLIFIFAPLLIHLFYGDKFMGAVLVARITAFALVGITLNYVYGTNYLIVIHREHLLRNITIVVSLIGFGVAFLLIPQLGVVGAACTYTISSLLIGVVPMIVSLYVKKNEKNIENCK